MKTNETKTAKITRIELVNGSMLSFTLALPAGMYVEQFDIETAIGGILNSSTDRKASTGLVNSYNESTDLKVGDEITADGEVIEASEAQGQIEATELKGKENDYRDVFAAKHGQKGL